MHPADAMDAERPNLVIIIDEPERGGLIICDRAPTDRRAHALRAMQSGRRPCERAVADVTAFAAARLGGIDEETCAGARAAKKLIEKAAGRGWP